jgi:hypothetical protein
MVADVQGPGQRVQDSGGDLVGGVFRGRLGEEECELVAAEAGFEVAAPDRLIDPPGGFDQYGVAGGVAEFVVDRFEAVQVEEHHGRAAGLPGHHLRAGLVEGGTVGQPGEGVVVGLVRQGCSLALNERPGYWWRDYGTEPDRSTYFRLRNYPKPQRPTAEKDQTQ